MLLVQLVSQNINGIDNIILQFAEIIEFNECFETK